MSKVISPEQAAALIPDNSVLSVSSSSGLGCPDLCLKAIGERFDKTGHPQNITSIHPIAAGDMYGIDGIDRIAKKGLLKRVLAGSLPSGPSSMDSPAIWKMIYANEVEAYNIPSGILFHMHREAAAKRPGILTKVGMGTYVDPRLNGARMNDLTPEAVVSLKEFDGEEWLYFKSIPVDVAIIRGTSADSEGNISMEHEGAYLGVYDQALAARNNGGIVIAQVKRIVEDGSIASQRVRVPGILVDHVVLDPDQMQTTQTQYEPAISGEEQTDIGEFDLAAFAPDKIIARRAALEIENGDAVNLGFGISALVPRILLEEGQSDKVTWVIEQGAVGGVPLLGFAFGCSSNAKAIVPSPDQFTYFQGGGFDRTMLSFMQVDRHGNVNVSRLSARPHVTAGVGGFIDITANARNIIFQGYFMAGAKLSLADGKMCIDAPGKVQKFIPKVEHVTFSGKRAIETGQKVLYVTERCVMRLTAEGMELIEIAPGMRLQEDILDCSSCDLIVSENLKEMDASLFLDHALNLKL